MSNQFWFWLKFHCVIPWSDFVVMVGCPFPLEQATELCDPRSRRLLTGQHMQRGGSWNSRYSSDKSFRARMTSSVDLVLVNPDWCGRWVLRNRGSRQASRTCANTFPGTDNKVMGGSCCILFSDLCLWRVRQLCCRASHWALYPSSIPEGTIGGVLYWLVLLCIWEVPGESRHFQQHDHSSAV